MRPGIIALVAALALCGTLVLDSNALAQSSSPSPPVTADIGSTDALEKLPPGEQKIARALWEAQVAPAQLTIDEIARLKLLGISWGEIFADFLMQNIVTEKNISQIMRQYKAELAQAARTPQ